HFGEDPMVPSRWRWPWGRFVIRSLQGHRRLQSFGPEAEVLKEADRCCRKGLRSKNDLDVKETVNLWAGKLRGSAVNAGQVLCGRRKDILRSRARSSRRYLARSTSSVAMLFRKVSQRAVFGGTDLRPHLIP